MNKKKKVMHIIYDMSTAGAQMVVMNYLRQMKNDEDYDVCVAVGHPYTGLGLEAELTEGNYEAYYCDYKPFTRFKLIRPIINWIKYQRAWKKILKEVKPDIVHTHLNSILPYTCLPIVFSNIKIKVHTAHGDPDLPFKYRIWSKIAYKIFGFYPVFVTQYQEKIGKSVFNLKRSSVIKNGLDLYKYKIHISKKEIRDELGISCDSFVLGFVGRLENDKNLEFLFYVFYKYLIRNKAATLLIVGEGEKRDKLVQYATSLGISDNVLFLGRRDDVQRIYKAMDVFMLTSKFESSSIVTVEAQLSNVRCVISDAIPDDVIITNLVNRISLSDSYDTWIEAIDGNIKPEDAINSYSDFDIKNSIKKTKQLYNKLN